MLLTSKLCNRFLFLQPSSAVSHRKFNWNVKASDTNQRDRKKWRGDTYNWSMILFSSHWYFHWIFHLLKLYITITSATWAFVWSQEFCIYLNYIIEDLQLVENFVDWQKGRRVGITWTEEAFGVHCKHHHLYFAALNWVLIQTFRQWLIRVFQ